MGRSRPRRQDVRADQSDPGDPRRGDEPRGLARLCATTRSSRLVIRANEGDCVEITVTNNASGGKYGLHIDGLPYDRRRRQGRQQLQRRGGLRVRPPSTATSFRTTRRSRVPTTSARARVTAPASTTVCSVCCRSSRPDSQWLSPKDAVTPIESGWEAVIVPGDDVSFREDVQILHEIGNEKENVYDKNNVAVADRRPDHRGVSSRAAAASTIDPSRSWTG